MNKRTKIESSVNGITLITLIITIIVLLILSGISLSFLKGDNEIINVAIDTGSENEKDFIEEQLNVAVFNSQMNSKNAKINIDILKSELDNLKNKEVIDSYYSGSNFSFPITVKKENYTFEIDEEGNVLYL